MGRLGGLALTILIGCLVLAPDPAGGTTAADHTADRPAERTAVRYREYVALGDSWTAAIGTSTPPSTEGPTPRGCLQSRTDYPHQVAEALGVATFRDASCQSAATRHLRRAQKLKGGGTNPPQFRRLTERTDLVTLGIGVNDAHLVSAVGKCLTRLGLGSCRATYVHDGVDDLSDQIVAARPKLLRVVRGIRERAPKARILVVNYLGGLPADGTSCWPISRGDATYFHERFIQLNAMLARVVRRTRVELVNTYRPSIGHDICQAADRWVDGLVPSSSTGRSFHPNQSGADAQARIVLRAIRR